MSFIQRELDRLNAAIIPDKPNQDRLYAAQQALAWALEPSGIKLPYEMITGILVGSEDYSGHPRQLQSSDTYCHNG